MKIAIGTTNKAKVQAVKAIFNTAEIIEVKVPSGVSEQPFSDEETRKGAINRATSALEKEKARIGIGLEGGVYETAEGMVLCNWGALCTNAGSVITAGGARIYLPEEVAAGVRAGKELAYVMEEYTHTKDVRSKEGAIGIFTNGYLSRMGMFEHIVSMLAGQLAFMESNGK